MYCSCNTSPQTFQSKCSWPLHPSTHSERSRESLCPLCLCKSLVGSAPMTPEPIKTVGNYLTYANYFYLMIFFFTQPLQRPNPFAGHDIFITYLFKEQRRMFLQLWLALCSCNDGWWPVTINRDDGAIFIDVYIAFSLINHECNALR